ncbi:uncharacterized protein MONOS_10288 [Monocercomonoides exilis]|uniref:uncharacterized protein n=1 Tax=Monocercomonoides exilis TaxID=2049356 RepID=UPI003559B5E1|nr:hypothetical protein MONOS_10288 [Monocercomonoides exilis]|eukprot:MONOS_10288.1-p1 / transcript=MONOS_10288.1 / gene=MONOS_10288 / organism=Monocercomonoides_exilis_PA203 / gene_product=unspecified product / transcript_product=unspecified product / location=Mono_scaffold00461:21903-22193(-) / protein_length=70 / sequence_SO=supercontig / SO=protein_coding / is_pseudo=false
MQGERGGSYEAEQREEILWAYDSLAAPLIFGARDGGRGGGSREEGTSGVTLCIRGVETEVRQGLKKMRC